LVLESTLYMWHFHSIIPWLNPLTPNDDYSGRTAPLTSKRCILYIYLTNLGTEYFKHSIYSPFSPLQNAVCFINLTYLFPVLFTFYIECVLKSKKIIPAPKGSAVAIYMSCHFSWYFPVFIPLRKAYNPLSLISFSLQSLTILHSFPFSATIVWSLRKCNFIYPTNVPQEL